MTELLVRRGERSALSRLEESQAARRALLERVKAPPSGPMFSYPSNVTILPQYVYTPGSVYTIGTAYPITIDTSGTYLPTTAISDLQVAVQNAANYYTNFQTTATTGTLTFTDWTGTTARFVPETEEQRARRAWVARKNEAQRNKAIKRGRKLLLSLLSDSQLLEYARTGEFTVTAPSGRFYRLRRRGTILELDPVTGVPLDSLCVHLPAYYIQEDNLITLLMMLTHEEPRLRGLANHTATPAGRERGLPSYQYGRAVAWAA